MFASRVTEIVPVQSDPPYEVTIRRLGWRLLERAQQESVLAGVALVQRFGGPVAVKEIQALSASAAAAADKPARDAAPQYDLFTVLKAGIVSWTAPDAISDSAIEDLDEPIAGQLYKRILRLSRVPVTDAEVQEEATARKND